MMRLIAWPAFERRELNPYPALLYSHMENVQVDEFSPRRLLTNKYGIWHIHWPEVFASKRSLIAAAGKSQLLLWLMDVARARGTKVVWTIHNISGHEQSHPNLEKWFWDAFTRRIDGFISLSQTGAFEALNRYPHLKDLPGYVVPHGHYRGEYPDDSSLNAREHLQVAAHQKVILFFGSVRNYKNVPELIQSFRQLIDDNLLLYVAGNCRSKELTAHIRSTASGDDRVRLDLRHIPHQDVQLYFRAADLVVLPYRNILNSGSAVLAISFNRPVLVPLKGAMAELRSLVGDEWVRTYSGELTPSQLRDALVWAGKPGRPDSAPLNALDWDMIAQQTIAAFEIIARTQRRGRALEADNRRFGNITAN